MPSIDSFAGLIREFGPIIVLFYVVFMAGPSLVGKMGTAYLTQRQSSSTTQEAPFTIASRLLDGNLEERRRNEANEEAFRQTLKGLSDSINTLKDELTKFSRTLEILVIKTNDMDERTSLYVRNTSESLMAISLFIKSYNEDRNK